MSFSPRVSEGLLKAQEYFNSAHIKLPFISDDDKQKIRKLEDGVYGTREETKSLYDINDYVKEVLSTPVEDYVVTGYAGHGVNSRAMHYYAVKGNLALFIQLQYGAVTNEPEAEVRERINSIFHGVHYIFDLMKEEAEKHEIPSTKKLLLVHSDFYGKGWEWFEGTPGDIDQAKWHTDDQAIFNAMAEIPTDDEVSAQPS